MPMDVRSVVTRRGAKPAFRRRSALARQVRGRYRRNPWSAGVLAKPIRPELLGRCLICQTDMVGARGALARPRGRYRKNPWSAAMLARPIRSKSVGRHGQRRAEG